MVSARKRYRPLYKKFIKLKVNPLNNEKIFEFKRKKWKFFLEKLRKTTTFYKKYKPYAHSNYSVSKFASPGNSYKRKFRNDLIAKKTFNYFYGGLPKKYLKAQMTKIYKSKEFRDFMLLCLEFFESRLDSILYRAKFCSSIKSARQLIAHKHIKVNNRIEKNKSYILKQGDLIQVSSKAAKMIKREVARHHLLDYKKKKLSNIGKQLKSWIPQSERDKLKFRREKLKNLLSILEGKNTNSVWPIPPAYLTINYNTLEIIVGDLKNYNFSTSFPFRLDINSVVTNYYRH